RRWNDKRIWIEPLVASRQRIRQPGRLADHPIRPWKGSAYGCREHVAIERKAASRHHECFNRPTVRKPRERSRAGGLRNLEHYRSREIVAHVKVRRCVIIRCRDHTLCEERLNVVRRIV